MSQLLVRDLDPKTIDRLKNRARQRGRSLQREVKMILEAAATYSIDEAYHISDDWLSRLEGKDFEDSAESIRLDREA
jgi:hypothetical protein